MVPSEKLLLGATLPILLVLCKLDFAQFLASRPSGIARIFYSFIRENKKGDDSFRR